MTDEDRKKGLGMIEQMLGKEEADRTRARWTELCPDFEKYVVGFLAAEIWARPGLGLKERSLCTIAALVALGRPQALELNIRMALNNGATEGEIVESLLQIAPYAGFPACWEGLTTAHKVFTGKSAHADASPQPH